MLIKSQYFRNKKLYLIRPLWNMWLFSYTLLTADVFEGQFNVYIIHSWHLGKIQSWSDSVNFSNTLRVILLVWFIFEHCQVISNCFLILFYFFTDVRILCLTCWWLIAGTPKSTLNIEAISEIACKEAELYLRHNLVL
jgi:hypothetical protein